MTDHSSKQPDDTSAAQHSSTEQPKEQQAQTATEKIAAQTAEDVRLTRNVFSLRRIIKWFMVLLLIVLLILAGLVALASTDRGTRYILDTISHVTKLNLAYDRGNLVSGLWLKEVAVPIDKNSTIYIDKARIKVGWRQFFGRDVVHLRDAYIHELKFQDINPPSGKPFKYMPINPPFKLLISQAQVDRFVYAKATRKDMLITQISASDLRLHNNQLSLTNGALRYKQYADIAKLSGQITFDRQYSIKATAELDVPMLVRQQFSTFDMSLSGSLATLRARLSGKWAGSPLTGDLTAYPVEKRSPYEGVFALDALKLPYAKTQNIVLDKGALAVKGNLNRVFLGLDTDMVGKDIPKGRYLISGQSDFSELILPSITAKTDIGEVAGNGHVRWKEGLAVDFDGLASGVNAHRYLPASVHAHLTDDFSGKVTLALTQKNKRLVLKTAIAQQLASKYLGNRFDGTITLVDNKLHAVVGTLKNRQITALPKGQYQFDLTKQSERIEIDSLIYRGDVGRFDAAAQLVLPSEKTKALSWQAHVTNVDMALKAFAPASPVSHLSGHVRASGTARGSEHRVLIDALDMATQIPQAASQDGVQASTRSKSLSLLGQGEVAFHLVDGTLDPVSATYSGNVTTAGLPKGSMVLDVAKQQGRVTINRLVHRSAKGLLATSGFVQLAEPSASQKTKQTTAWQLTGKLVNFNPAVVLPAYSGNLSGSFRTDGIWSDDAQRIHIERMDVTGSLKGKPLVARGALHVDLSLPKTLSAQQLNRAVRSFSADDLRVQWANNTLTAAGNQNKVLLDVDVSSLHRLYPAIAGTLQGKVAVSGLKKSQPTAELDLTAADFRVGTMGIAKGKITGTLMDFGRQPSSVSADLAGVRVNQHSVKNMRVSLQGTQAEHRIRFDATHAQARLVGVLQGSLRQALWQGQLTDGKISSRLVSLHQQKPATLTLDTAKRDYRISAHCWRSQKASGSFCLDDDLAIRPSGGRVQASLKQLDSVFFASFLPDDMLWKGKLQGNARLHWQKNQDPRINAVFYSDNGSIGLITEDPQDEDITLDYNRLSVILATQSKGLKVRIDAKTPTAGNGYIDAVIDPKSPDKTINGAMVLDDIRLNVLRPFFPRIRSIEGTASLAGGMSGPLRGPQYYGNFKLKNGAIAMLGMPVNLTDINLKSSIRGTKATLDGRFLSGKGQGKISGSADWKDDVHATIKLAGKSLAVRHPPVLFAKINPDVAITVKPYQRQLTVSGKVDVVQGMIRAPDADPKVVKQSGDVVVIRQPTQKTSAGAAGFDKNDIDNAIKVASPFTINSDLKINVVKDTYFKGFGARIPLTGGVHITQSARTRGKMRGKGMIEVAKRLPVNVFGQSLDLTRGRIRFTGNLAKPTLDIEAMRKISGSNVGVRVEGSPEKPKVEVFNDAGLNKQEAMNALVTGRIEGSHTTTAAGFQDSVNNALAAAGLNQGLQSTHGFTNRIGRNLGLSGLTVDASGSDNDANVNITGYLTPDLYLRYGVGVFTPVDKLTLRYQLSKRVYIEASSAIEKAIDVFYNWRF